MDEEMEKKEGQTNEPKLHTDVHISLSKNRNIFLKRWEDTTKKEKNKIACEEKRATEVAKNR